MAIDAKLQLLGQILLQAGLPPLDFSGVHGRERQRYIAAIHAALERDYVPMTAVFDRIVARTMRVNARA